MKPMSGSRLLRLSAVLIAARILGAGLTFVTQILIARWFGADTLGYYAVAMSLGGVLAIMAAGGYPSIAQRFIARYRHNNRTDLTSGFISAGRRAIALVGAVLVILTCIGLWTIDVGRNPAYTWALAIGVLCAPAMALLNFHGALANAERQPFLGFLPDTLLRPVLLIALVLAAGLTVTGELSAVQLMAMSLSVAALAAMLQWTLMRRAGFGQSRHVPRAYESREWRQSAIPLTLIVLFTNYFIDIDILLLSTLLSPEQIAVFNICVRFTAFIVFALHSVNQITLPDLADAHTRTDRAGVVQALARANLAGVGLALTATIGLAILGQPILARIGPEFTGGYILLLVLSIAQLARAALGSASVQLLTVTGHQTKALPALIGGVVVLILLNVLLVPIYALEGAGVAMLASIILWSAWLSVLAYRVTGYDVTIWSSLRHLVSADRKWSGTSERRKSAA